MYQLQLTNQTKCFKSFKNLRYKKLIDSDITLHRVPNTIVSLGIFSPNVQMIWRTRNLTNQLLFSNFIANSAFWKLYKEDRSILLTRLTRN